MENPYKVLIAGSPELLERKLNETARTHDIVAVCGDMAQYLVLKAKQKVRTKKTKSLIKQP